MSDGSATETRKMKVVGKEGLRTICGVGALL